MRVKPQNHLVGRPLSARGKMFSGHIHGAPQPFYGYIIILFKIVGGVIECA
jgi:hypothetical protein